MPELLLEVFSEEIPARMQKRAAEDLQKLVTDALVDAGLVYEHARSFSTPRRLALVVDGLPARQPDLKEERKGPRVGAPEQALAGFIKAAGLKDIAEAEIRPDKKGDIYVAVIERAGRAATEVITEIVPEVIRKFPWPKSMRWGAGSLRWVRPLHSILCTFGTVNEDPDVVGFEVDGITSGNITYGHRFMAPGPIEVRRFDDYEQALGKAFVMLDRDARKDAIATDAKTLAFAQGLELVEDQALLDEVAGLVEWPKVLIGEFDKGFLAVPPEVLATSMKAHQKCFSLSDPKTGALANRFVTVANLEASDGGAAITAGNERVIAARLSDARFFWEQDLKVKLEDRAKQLDNIVFHEKLGTQGQRVERISRLARELAPMVGADADKAERAAQLCKADLVSEMVGEFPELQGLMGRYYAQEEGEDASIATALEDHYKPQGPSDRVPADPVAIAVALADKLDMLVGFWAIDEKPTGSKDPYALRRAALGVIRIVLENELRIDLTAVIKKHSDEFEGHDWAATTFGLIDFLGDRLEGRLRDQGERFDLVRAVLRMGMQREQMKPGMENVRDLCIIVKRIEALGAFLKTDDGANLLAGVKRAGNILDIEQKKDGRIYDAAPKPALLKGKAEKALADALDKVSGEVEKNVAAEDFAAAMTALAALRPAVDAFFDDVTVNADDKRLRANRLCLLNRLRKATLQVADFSKIEG